MIASTLKECGNFKRKYSSDNRGFLYGHKKTIIFIFCKILFPKKLLKSRLNSSIREKNSSKINFK